MTRDKAMTTISTIYGLDETTEGENLLMEIIADMGFAALTDEAVILLAKLHLEQERAESAANAAT